MKILLFIVLVSVSLLGCAEFERSKQIAMDAGYESGVKSKLDTDEESFFETNKEYLSRSELAEWSKYDLRVDRDKVRKSMKLDELVEKRKLSSSSN